MSGKMSGSNTATRPKRHTHTGNAGDDRRRFALRCALERENEYSRIARVLHDDIGQTLMAMNLGLYRLSRICGDDSRLQDAIAELRSVLMDTSRATRRLAAEFRPCAIHAGEIQPLLSALGECMSVEYGISCITSAVDTTPLPGRAYAAALYRVLRLAVHGMSGQHHSPASRLLVEISEEKRMLIIRISGPDNSRHDSEIEQTTRMEDLRAWVCALNGEMRTEKKRCGGALLHIVLPLPG